MEIVLATDTTDLAQTGGFECRNKAEITFVAIDGDIGGAVDLEYWDGAAWQKATDADGTAVALSATRTTILFDGPGIHRWNRDGVQAQTIGVGAFGAYQESALPVVS